MRQAQALAVMMAGQNVFLTGAPGAGKTYVLNQFTQYAKQTGKTVAVTASTGIAASHLNGTTIHSWSGLGIIDRLTDDDLQRLRSNAKLQKRYNSTDTLVIDEVSMLHGVRLDMLNTIAKVLRESAKPFGGMQVILVGDLFQLPPVSRGGGALDFIHHSKAWDELKPRICYITEQHRQEAHDGLLDLLQAMRRGELEEMHRELLGDRLGREAGDDSVLTRLFAHNVDVETINNTHLNALDTDVYEYEMYTKGNKYKVEGLVKSVLAPQWLSLKRGAEVMFVANNFTDGFVNGSRGRVVDFAGETPIVELLNGRTIEVKPNTWSIMEDGKTVAEAMQLPLRLAWAITIHKSQGMSLDAAEVDLSRAFTPGMGYVALSRVRSLDGLYLKGINRTAMEMHPQIYGLDADLLAASEELAAVTQDFSSERIEQQSKAAAAVDEALFEELKKWRAARAAKEGLPPFMVAHNTALAAVAAARPQNKKELLGVPGFGPLKVDTFGPEIVAVVTAFVSS